MLNGGAELGMLNCGVELDMTWMVKCISTLWRVEL